MTILERGMFQYIRSVELSQSASAYRDRFPLTLPAIQNLGKLELHPNVSFIVGENGIGKSTLLEAIAIAYGFNPEGGSRSFNFSTNDTHSDLSYFLKLTRGVLTAKDGFFLRAESLYNLASNIDNLNEDDGELIQYYGGKSLHEQSHGEAFISLMMNRFSSKGLYILDEPEAALSPTRQMALITRINDLVKRDSQFIIATHSPIIMSYTNADIFDIENGYKIVDYKETEHYAVTREFLNNTDKMLEILLEE